MAAATELPHSAVVDAARRCALAAEGDLAEAAAQELASSVSHVLESASLASPEAEVGLHDCLMILQAMLEPSVAAFEGCAENLAERAGWDLLCALARPFGKGLSPRCKMACGAIIVAIAHSGKPRELFTAFMEGIQGLLECAIAVERSNLPEVKEPWLQLQYLLSGLAVVLSRIPRRVDHFFGEARGLLARVGNVVLEELSEGLPSLTINGDPAEFDKQPNVENIIKGLVNVARVVSNRMVETEGEQRERLERELALYALCLLAVGSPIWGRSRSHGRSSVPGGNGDEKEELMTVLSCLLDCDIDLHALLADRHGRLLQELHEFAADESEDIEEMRRQRRDEKLIVQGASLAVALSLSDAQVGRILSRKAAAHGEECLPGGSSVSMTINSSEAVQALRLAVPLLRNYRLAEEGLVLVEAVIEEMSPVEASSTADLAIPLFPTLQALQEALLVSPPQLGKRYFSALQKVLRNALPSHARMDALEALIAKCNNPMLVSLLLMFAKDEALTEWPEPGSHECELEVQKSAFASTRLLHLIEETLRPSDARPPILPDDADAILGALNVYRFLLLREIAGGSNHTQCRTAGWLSKVRNQWLLPLRHLAGAAAEQLAAGEQREESEALLMSVQAVASVVHRCLQIVEADMEQSSPSAVGGMAAPHSAKPQDGERS